MKKSSFIFATLVMTLALIVAIVGVTAAWFGDIFDYRSDVISITSSDPTNNAIIVPNSNSQLPTGEAAVFAPARLKAGYGLNDVDGSGYNGVGFDDLIMSPSNEYGAKLSDVIEKPAVPVVVSFDFVYNGSPANPDGITTRIKMELVSVTLRNPTPDKDLTGDGIIDGEDVRKFLSQDEDKDGKLDTTNYRDEFGIEMYVTTTTKEVMTFTDVNSTNEDKKYYTMVEEKETVDGKEVKNVYYRLKEDYYYYKVGENLMSKTRLEEELEKDPDYAYDPYSLYFDFIPFTHSLYATIYFLKIDEATPPELIGTQLFLNFEVTYITHTGGETNEN